MPFQKAKLCVDLSVKTLCPLPYYNHPKGCPNYGHKVGCPPQSASVGDVIDLQRDTWVVWTIYDLATHIGRMQDKYPTWSPRQLSCCLYWQGTARKILKQEIQRFQVHHWQPGMTIVHCPEAMGINVTQTMLSIGQHLQWPPITKTYQVVVTGYSVVEFIVPYSD